MIIYLLAGIMVGWFFGAVMVSNYHQGIAEKGGYVTFNGRVYKITEVM